MTMSARVLAVAALSTLLVAAAPASAAEPSCSGRFHAALSSIEAEEYAALKAAQTIAFKGDGAMPGAFVFAPPSMPRSREEMAALKEANSLARGRGRPAWLASADSRWLADRVTSELGDYLSQEETPFLCGGVVDYLALLRAQIARVGGGATDGEALVTVQAKATRQAIRAAEAAARPAPSPRYAPPYRNLLLSIVDFRPSRGLERDPAIDPMQTNTTFKDFQGPRIDPDLPPLAMVAPIPLATDADRLAAIDRLIAIAAARDLVASLTEEDMGDAEEEADAPEQRPVLARLAALQPAFAATTVPASEAPTRRALLAALSAIEALDYLAHRPAPGGDPMLAAIERTFTAIESAHTTSCDCRN
ncbi:hypothetical protein GTW51_05360 [Aurantimonas aggregata]|uniref:Uncharacterized protein n=1 Tax=Aurantimonas aggregata TaxID=2047720 RepID=A0A6L9MEM1_9HYPH|nr:hypothetical protein [Aurantimonas aggregata]NDV86126.1 hypothetical protein [Aurantimonas aggregata]